jgi:general secretion pathway protein D
MQAQGQTAPGQDAATQAASASGPATTSTASAPATQGAGEVSIALRGMSVEQIGMFLHEKLARPVQIDDAVKDKKVNIIAKDKMPLDQALKLLRQAMLDQEVLVEVRPDLIHIRSLSDVLKLGVPQIAADVPMSAVDESVQVATKEFSIRHYDIKKLVQVLQPMLPGWGRIWADQDMGKLVVTDSVENLLNIERVIQGIDVPLAERTVTKIIVLEHADPLEVIAILRWLIAGRMGVEVTDITTAAGEAKPSRPEGQPAPGAGPPGQPGRPSEKPAEVQVTVQRGQARVMLVPHVSRSWIIAVAPAEMMPQIEEWARQYDKPREVEKDYEILDIRYADIEDIAQQIRETIRNLPNVELRQTTQVVPFAQSHKLIIFGSRAGRDIVRDLIERLDVQDAGKHVRKTFVLKHADAEYMAQRIRSLFDTSQKVYESRWGTQWRPDDRTRQRLQAVPDRRRNTVTVLADSESMKEVEKLIAEEDQPVDTREVLPKVYDLKYVDPGEMRDLLDGLFSERKTAGGDFFDFFFFGGSSGRQETLKVGRLLGQFSFQVLPSSNKLLVTAKSTANYEVIDRLVEMLDKPHTADLPVTVELKYANAEDLCEQINAMLAEPGHFARIRRAERGLVEYGGSDRTIGASSQTDNRPAGNQPRQQAASPNEMVFWWQEFRPPRDAVPTSNLIGRIRVVPVYRRNALMVLAPPIYRDSMVKLIQELDNPGRQVMIRARVGEIQHEDQTTLGLRIASDPSLLPGADTAISGGAGAAYRDVLNGVWTVSADVNVDAMLNLLIRQFDMKILLAPTLTTSDNEASEYFDGQDVPIQTQSRQSAEGTSTVTDIAYEPIGTRLRVRPHVTQNDNVDLMVNLEISRVVPGTSALGNFIFDRREVTTHVIVNNAQTVMLSGIVQQDKFDDVHKVPLLGDIPLLGKLFRHIDQGVRNREMVVFLTPFVIKSQADLDEQMAEPRETMRRVEQALGAATSAPATQASQPAEPN